MAERATRPWPPAHSDSEEDDDRKWSLWIDRESGELRANQITPTWGGGGFIVVPAPGQDGMPPVL